MDQCDKRDQGDHCWHHPQIPVEHEVYVSTEFTPIKVCCWCGRTKAPAVCVGIGHGPFTE